MNRRTSMDLAIGCSLVAISVVSRLIPHAPNFTPVAAIVMFASFYFRNWKIGVAVPLISLVLSDLVVGMYEPALMASVYVATLVPLLFGRALQRRLKPGRLAICSLCSSTLFFLTTNLAVWLFGSWYTSNWEGLVSCFVAGVPFFRYTVASDILFSTAIFGIYALLLNHWPSIARVAGAWIKGAVLPAPVA